mgnify:CR=1 FL=1
MSEFNSIKLPREAIAAFCRKWKVVRLEVFGSALREDFSPESDVDLLVTFEEDADWSLFDHAQMEMELSEILSRDVDLITRRSIESSRNPYRRREILNQAQTVYEAA